MGVRRLFWQVLVGVLLVLALASCGDDGDATAGPRPVFVAAEVRATTERLGAVVEGHADAWTAGDVDAVLSYWDDDTVHDDTGNMVLLTGEDLFSMPAAFLSQEADFGFSLDRVFVASDVALTATSLWGVGLRGVDYTEQERLLEIARIEVDAEGTFGQWTIRYGIDAYERTNAPATLIDAAVSVLDSYELAWNSGESGAVAALYAAAAERADTLLDSGASGQDAIEAYATDFFGWYPDAELVPGSRFSDNRGTTNDPDTFGSTFRIENVGSDGSDCAVEMAVVLTVRDGLVMGEEVFWDGESLISCGWAV